MASNDGGRPPEEEEQVMSEVHLGCPPGLSGPFTSQFVISVPPSVKGVFGDKWSSKSNEYEVDEDGDLILSRRSKCNKDEFVVIIRHNITSSIPRVGMQVWKAELVLADFVLHKMFTSQEFNGIVAIELGAGTGLVGMLLARVAQTVFITDHGEEILDNCSANINLNAGVIHSNASVYVRELDWNSPSHLQVIDGSQSEKSYNWIKSEVEEVRKASLILAADVIYSDDLTTAFLSTVHRIMYDQPEKVLYLALEKRYNFSLDDLDVVANGYSHFRSYVVEEGCDDLKSPSPFLFLGKQVDLAQIPQYVRDYERGNDVEVWQIKYDNRNT